MPTPDSTAECEPTFVLTTPRIHDLVTIGQRSDPRVPLLIRGEPGVGKNTVARLIHAASARKRYPFMKMRCTVQPVDRLEAELFGQEKGVSPSATRRRLGSFEFANHGTLYLDQIGTLPRLLVPKLLCVLRTGEVARVGSVEVVRADVRVIASTTQSEESAGYSELWEELRRLNVVEMCIPALRQRPEEIPVFASFFLTEFNRRYGRNVQLSTDRLAMLMARPWPGNLRELEEEIHRLIVCKEMALTH